MLIYVPSCAAVPELPPWDGFVELLMGCDEEPVHGRFAGETLDVPPLSLSLRPGSHGQEHRCGCGCVVPRRAKSRFSQSAKHHSHRHLHPSADCPTLTPPTNLLPVPSLIQHFAVSEGPDGHHAERRITQFRVRNNNEMDAIMTWTAKYHAGLLRSSVSPWNCYCIAQIYAGSCESAVAI